VTVPLDISDVALFLFHAKIAKICKQLSNSAQPVSTYGGAPKRLFKFSAKMTQLHPKNPRVLCVKNWHRSEPNTSPQDLRTWPSAPGYFKKAAKAINGNYPAMAYATALAL
jgi:hypothetical protein